MSETKARIFRKEALERLSTPERLDELVPLVDPRSWLALATFGALMAAALVWSLTGRLSTTVTGRGVLLAPASDTDAGAAVVHFTIADGGRVQPGMRVEVTPDSVERARFGSIIGKVRTVSAFPVTRSEATPQIDVMVDLERDRSSPGGYRWSASSGPKMRIPPGTTATARVTVESRAPISYILPFLRSRDGGH